MKKFVKIIFIVAAVLFIVAQFYRIDQTNPPTVAGETIEDVVAVPADVSQILSVSCNDCHSNKTAYPWYSNISPFSIFLEDHIREGRMEMNLSKFATYSKEKQTKLLEEICEETTGRTMPLPSYLWIHRDAELTESQIGALCNWTKTAASDVASRN